jgi:hypothetical protein
LPRLKLAGHERLPELDVDTLMKWDEIDLRDW